MRCVCGHNEHGRVCFQECQNQPKPLDIDLGEPRMYVQKVGKRWRSWVEMSGCVVERENGTYSWTRKRAEKKARKLLEFTGPNNPNPIIQVTDNTTDRT